MNLLPYIEDMAARRSLAEACGTSPEYLWQVATNWNGRKASHELARRIETATEGKVTIHDLRPDIFGEAPSVAAA